MTPEVWPPWPWSYLRRGKPVAVGDVIHVRADDYRTGRGPLVLRVTRLGEIQQERDVHWRHVYGVQLRADGEAVKNRWVLVRVEALQDRHAPQQRRRR